MASPCDRIKIQSTKRAAATAWQLTREGGTTSHNYIDGYILFLWGGGVRGEPYTITSILKPIMETINIQPPAVLVFFFKLQSIFTDHILHSFGMCQRAICHNYECLCVKGCVEGEGGKKYQEVFPIDWTKRNICI